MKLRRIFGFALWLAGLFLVYVSFQPQYAASNPAVKDLKRMGGFLLLLTSTFTQSAWANLSRQGSSSLALTYGGIWFRFVAALLDFMFAGVSLLGVTRVTIDVADLAGWANLSPRLAGLGIWPVAILFFGYWIYFAAMESSPWEATLGKIALRLRVTDFDGHRITFARATGRYLGPRSQRC